MSDDNDDLWFVQLGEGTVRAFTLDQLDEAFQAGTIDEASLVRLDGTAEWKPLGEVLAGAEETPPASSPSQVIAVHDAQPPSAPPPPVELGLDIDENPSFGGSRKRVVGAVAAVAVLGAVAFTAVRVSQSPAAEPSKLGAALPPPVGAAAPPSEEAKPDGGTRLNDEQRKLLMQADKKLEAELAAKRSERAAKNPGPSKPIKIGDPIKKGGNKFDPLNGAL